MIENARKHIPFNNCDEWAEHVNNFGLPIIRKNFISTDRKKDKGSIFDCNDKSDLSQIISSLICNGFGLPIEITSKIIGKSLVESGTARE